MQMLTLVLAVGNPKSTDKRATKESIGYSVIFLQVHAYKINLNAEVQNKKKLYPFIPTISFVNQFIKKNIKVQNTVFHNDNNETFHYS